MTPVKMWFLLLLSVLFIAPTVSKVVKSMTDCGEFLLNNKPPQVPHVLENGHIQDNNRYKVICQTYKDVRRFVTLYDTQNRIPVLSAYKFTGTEKGKRKCDNIWMIEPQLEDINSDKINMEDCNIKDKERKYNNQASDEDYRRCRYDRGHLLPSSYANTEDDKASTCTLTNVVPQVQSFNQGSWARMESRVKEIMEEFCIDNNGAIEGYVITGAKPSDSNTINERVNVPSLLWSAFCCEDKKSQTWISGAYWGDNVKDGNLMPATLEQLYDQLSDGDNGFEAFPGSSCPLDKTIDDLDLQQRKKFNRITNPKHCEL